MRGIVQAHAAKSAPLNEDRAPGRDIDCGVEGISCQSRDTARAGASTATPDRWEDRLPCQWPGSSGRMNVRS